MTGKTDLTDKVTVAEDEAASFASKLEKVNEWLRSEGGE